MHILLTFNQHIRLGPNQSFRDFLDVWKMIGFSEFRGSGFRYEDLLFVGFCLQMLHDKILKPNNEVCLKCKYQLKQKTRSRENVATDKKCIL